MADQENQGEAIQLLLADARRREEREQAAMPARLPPRPEPNPDVEVVIQKIRDNPVKKIDEVLVNNATCPGGDAFLMVNNVPKFPQIPYRVATDADANKGETAKLWALDLAVCYAHVRVSWEESEPMWALGVALAYYFMRRGNRSEPGAYDTDEADVMQAARAWLGTGENGKLPVNIGRITGVDDRFTVPKEVPRNLFFLMALTAGHGRTMTRTRIEKFMSTANNPVTRVTCNPQPKDMEEFWKGLDACGGVGKTEYIKLASTVYAYLKKIPTMEMLSDQAQLRGMAAFSFVARLHVEYPGVDLTDFWSVAGMHELQAIGDVLALIAEKSAFAALFSSLTAGASTNLKNSAKMAIEFFKARGEEDDVKNLAAFWAKRRLSPEMHRWVDANKHVGPGGTAGHEIMSPGGHRPAGDTP